MIIGRDEDPKFFSSDPDPAQLEKKNRIRFSWRKKSDPDPAQAPDSTLIRNE